MKILKKTWFIALVLAVVLVIGVQYYIKAQGTEATTLTAKEIREQIEEVYDGEVLAFTINGDTFEATLAKEGAEYALEGSAASGEVYSLVQTKETTIADAGNQEQTTDASKEEKQPEESLKEEQKEQPKEDKPKEDKPNEKDEPKKEAKKPVKQEEKSTTRITEEEAGQIGLNELPEGMVGEIDDIDFVSTDQGGYYLVEIELDDDYHDDYEYDEVIYQIHALSGEVLTTTWDD